MTEEDRCLATAALLGSFCGTTAPDWLLDEISHRWKSTLRTTLGLGAHADA